MNTFKASRLIAAITLTLGTVASAQTLPASIARVQMTDNELSCTQIFKEINQMDGVMSMAAGGQAPGAGAADGGVGAQVANQVAGAVAQQAMGQVAARIPGLGGLFGGGGNTGGGLGGLFGGGGNAAPATGSGFLGGLLGQAAQGAAQNVVAAQAQQAQVAAQNQAVQQAQGAALSTQAAARKEHLTGVFLSKGCKLSDVQR